MDQDMLGVMRAQAWERAKGELKSILSAYHSNTDEGRLQFNQMHEAVMEFIHKVEDNGWAE